LGFSSMLMCASQTRLEVEGMQHLDCLVVVEVVEALLQCLAVERDGAVRRTDRSFQQARGMTAEHLLDCLRVEALQDVANGGVAGARFQRRPNAAFSRGRCTLIKVSIERREFPPVTTARIENSRT
jgi:hypothetical protein